MPSDLTCELRCNALVTLRVYLVSKNGVFVGVHDYVLKADYLLSEDRGLNQKFLFTIFQFLPPHFTPIVQQLFRLLMFLCQDCVRPSLFRRARVGEYESSLLAFYSSGWLPPIW